MMKRRIKRSAGNTRFNSNRSIVKDIVHSIKTNLAAGQVFDAASRYNLEGIRESVMTMLTPEEAALVGLRS